MKHILNYILVPVAALLLAACNLDLYPTTAIVYDETQPVIQKSSDLISFENNIMANFRGTQSGIFYALDDVMCDAFNATVGYGNNYGPIHRTNEDFTASDNDVESFWGSYYTVIKNYNIAINAANTIADADLREDAKTMKGEPSCSGPTATCSWPAISVRRTTNLRLPPTFASRSCSCTTSLKGRSALPSRRFTTR